MVTLHVLVAAALVATAAAAPPKAGGKAPGDTVADVPATPSGEPNPSLELEPARDGYSYNPQGRRDPFISLLKPVAETGQGKKPQGVAGIMIQELALKGIVKDAVLGYIALLVGPNGTTYFCKAGQRMYDGAITAIDAATVKFRQEVTDPLAPVKVREITKTLYPSEEARQ